MMSELLFQNNEIIFKNGDGEFSPQILLSSSSSSPSPISARPCTHC